jgi:hypothetical protein
MEYGEGDPSYYLARNGVIITEKIDSDSRLNDLLEHFISGKELDSSVMGWLADGWYRMRGQGGAQDLESAFAALLSAQNSGNQSAIQEARVNLAIWYSVLCGGLEEEGSRGDCSCHGEGTRHLSSEVLRMSVFPSSSVRSILEKRKTKGIWPFRNHFLGGTGFFREGKRLFCLSHPSGRKRKVYRS